MIWTWLARFVLKYRIPLLTVILAITAVMGFFATRIEIEHNFTKLLPANDSTNLDYEFFKKKFGQDGNVLVIATDKKPLEKLENFNLWYDLTSDIKQTDGIKEVVSLARLNDLILDDSLGKFNFTPLYKTKPRTQAELDSLLNRVEDLPFYKGIIVNYAGNTTLIAVTFKESELGTANRIVIANNIKLKVDAFAQKTGLEMHTSGLPYIRSAIAEKVKNETGFFLLLAFVITGIVLFIFFRNLLVVLFSLAVVVIGVIWSFGTHDILGYKITVLSGIIPPLIIVIGVPNCILLLNKYHSEFGRTGDKMLSLRIAVERVSNSLFFANVTTSVGFAVFCLINNEILFQFGIIAALNVMATYIISVVLVPIIFSYLPSPSPKQTNHLDAKRLRAILGKIDFLVENRRTWIYSVVAILVGLSLYGMTTIVSLGYRVDDLPKKDIILKDLKYFEKEFTGALPFEITIDTRKPRGVFANNGRVLYKINKLYKLLAQYKEFGRPISIIDGVKFSYQALKGGDPKYYKVPSATDLKQIADYAQEVNGKNRQTQLASFIDSTRQFTRVSCQMADVGSKRVAEMVKEMKPRIDSLFNYDSETNLWLSAEEKYETKITGNSVMYLKGNSFLVDNLIESVLWAVLIIALIMFALFTSARMIVISIVPSLVALIITAGLMGFAGIPLKPSTILVFSIAFGISSDGTLYFLTKYRHEIKRNKLSISDAVDITIKETGVSMIYTALILFFGFGIFIFSDFGGTAALGILISFTLLVAYCCNLILLPAFLLTLEKRILGKAFLQEPLIQMYDEEDDMDMDKLKLE
jgi:uncharacterized protein